MIECGFEFEFGHDIPLETIKQVLRINYPNYKVKFTYDYGSKKHRDIFSLKHDYSIDIKCKYILEIATPVFIGEYEILENFENIFNILKVLKVKTNETCSIHINIGFSTNDEILKMHLGKLYLYANEKEYLKLFNRLDNSYCRSTITKTKIKSILKLKKSDEEKIEKINNHLITGPRDHNKAITLDKCNEDDNLLNIIEFRFIGGDYLIRYNDCEKTLKHIIDSMQFCIQENNIDKTKTIFKKYIQDVYI